MSTRTANSICYHYYGAILCRACILEEEKHARFEGDSPEDWEVIESKRHTSAAEYPLDLDPEKDFDGTYCMLATGEPVCQYRMDGLTCMSEPEDCWDAKLALDCVEFLIDRGADPGARPKLEFVRRYLARRVELQDDEAELLAEAEAVMGGTP